MRYATELAERQSYRCHEPRASYEGVQTPRQSFHHPRTSLGAAGHLLHLGMVAAPLVIGEVFQDADKRWRAMRIVPVVGAIASEVLWTVKLAHERKKDEQAHAALEECHDRCR
jgi:hypothetical protein